MTDVCDLLWKIKLFRVWRWNRLQSAEHNRVRCALNRFTNSVLLEVRWNRYQSLLFPKVIFVTFGVFKFLFGVIWFTFGETISTSYIGCQSPAPLHWSAMYCTKSALLAIMIPIHLFNNRLQSYIFFFILSLFRRKDFIFSIEMLKSSSQGKIFTK